MPSVQGFVQSLEARSDGSVAVEVLSPHSGNQRQTLTLPNLDGDLTKVHKKLAQLGLLRDALSATLPVVLQYHVDAKQGDLLDEITALPTRSIEGRLGGSWVSGRVLGLVVRERGPESASSPYRDEADEALVVFLLDSGDIETYRLDLQRRYQDTGHAVFGMCSEARRLRRTIRLFVHAKSAPERVNRAAADTGLVLGSDWPAVATAGLQEVPCFIERLGQRRESYDAGERRTFDHLWVSYRTAPEMSPEGDVSANGAFVPESGVAWVHADSPLAVTLRAALQDGLQVRLGLQADEIHSVELYCPLASAARPVWISFDSAPLCSEPQPHCVSVPTIQGPTHAVLDAVPHDVRWRGTGWFARGLWRLTVVSAGPTALRIDGKAPCFRVEPTAAQTGMKYRADDKEPKDARVLVAHAYLCGVHEVELDVTSHSCGGPFRFLAYRIR